MPLMYTRESSDRPEWYTYVCPGGIRVATEAAKWEARGWQRGPCTSHLHFKHSLSLASPCDQAVSLTLSCILSHSFYLLALPLLVLASLSLFPWSAAWYLPAIGLPFEERTRSQRIVETSSAVTPKLLGPDILPPGLDVDWNEVVE